MKSVPISYASHMITLVILALSYSIQLLSSPFENCRTGCPMTIVENNFAKLFKKSSKHNSLQKLSSPIKQGAN